MIRSPLGLRLDPARPIREQIREAARLGARGVVIDAIGDLAPDRLSETGRREIRHLLRSVELGLIALNLPTRRPFDTIDQLDDRLRRAENAFAMAYELGTTLVLARVGGVPPEVGGVGPRDVHRGPFASLAAARTTGASGWRSRPVPMPARSTARFSTPWPPPAWPRASTPPALLQNGHDPASVTRALGPWVAHAYAADAAVPSFATAMTSRSGRPAGALDWEAYLGALEEVNYRGYLTVWPDPARDPNAQFTAISDRLKRL